MPDPLEIMNRLSGPSHAAMTDDKLRWVCSLVERYRPECLLEVGIGTGGSTAVLANCLDRFLGKWFIDAVDPAATAVDGGHIGHRLSDAAMDAIPHVEQRIRTFGDGKGIAEVYGNLLEHYDMVVLDVDRGLPWGILDLVCIGSSIGEGTVVVANGLCSESPWFDLHPADPIAMASSPGVLSALPGKVLLPWDSPADVGAVEATGPIDADRLLLSLCHRWSEDVSDSRWSRIRRIADMEFGRTVAERLTAIRTAFRPRWVDGDGSDPSGGSL